MSDIAIAKNLVKEYTASYASYVATNRAIPALIDGLKPVWRRCINSADDLKIYHNKKHMKVSKLAGQVLGDYHPHGGANPVPLAQDFTMRYPMFEGQGNFGSPDMPNSYAASRYIEIRLSEFCEDFYLSSADYADKEDNYDGRMKEITLYYPPLPGVLFTGSSGIAVGLSTSLPTHSIKDISDSILKYINNPDSKDYLEGLYPETCEKSVVMTPIKDIQSLYTTGECTVQYKAATHYESIDDKYALVVDAFPPDFSKKKLEKPAVMDYVDKGLLELSNESSTDVRYVFTSTDKSVLADIESRLVSSVNYRMYIEHRGVIKKYTLKEIYDTFIQERCQYITRKYMSMLEDVEKEYEYLNILLVFKDNKSYIKNMFDKSSDEVIQDIQDKYKTTEKIARRIINTSLRSLMSDNRESLLSSIERLKAQREEYQSYIDNPLSKVITDIEFIKGKYSDEKKAKHVDNEQSTYKVRLRRRVLKLSKGSSYFVGYYNNDVKILYGEDIASMDLSGVCGIVSTDWEYYFLHDERGCCTVDRGTMMTSGSKLKSDHLTGIIGINNVNEITIQQGNGKVYEGVDWSVRKKVSYIRLSKESEPAFTILTSHKSI